MVIYISKNELEQKLHNSVKNYLFFDGYDLEHLYT